MIREVSAGGVVLRRMRGNWYIALIEPAVRKETPSGSASKTRRKSEPKPIRALPKGLVEPGENPQETARREVNEETGVQADPITKLGDIKYFYVRSWGDRERVFKIVSFYLFRYRSGTLGEISEEMRREVQSAEWVPLEEAPRALSYRTERQMVEKAREYLQGHPEL
jgi:8-oxo-dGTP pyrophosphatase MutT (NUDIX family)